MFGAAIVSYLFCGGAGAGACLILAVLTLLIPSEEIASPSLIRKQRNLFLPVWIVSLGFLVVGALCLLLDLGRMDRVLLLLEFHLTFLNIGAYALGLLIVVTALSAFLWLYSLSAQRYVCGGPHRVRIGQRGAPAGLQRSAPAGLHRAYAGQPTHNAAQQSALTAQHRTRATQPLRSSQNSYASQSSAFSVAQYRVLPVVLALLSLVVMSYTGFMLSDLAAVPLWATPALPALFILSSLSCGSSIVLAVSWISGAAGEFSRVMRGIALFDIAIMVIELVVVGLFLYPVISTPVTPTDYALIASLVSLISGWYAPYFWVLFVGIGMLLPLVLYAILFWYNRHRPRAVRRASSVNSALLRIAVSACILLGGATLRWCVVSAGMHPVVTSLLGA